MSDEEICVAAMKEWPEAARPAGLRLHTAGWFVCEPFGRIACGKPTVNDQQYCNENTAIALFRDSGLGWLLVRHREFYLEIDAARLFSFQIHGAFHTGDTLLSAIDAAIKSLTP